MNNAKPTPSPEPQTTVLHLNKFVPKPPGEPVTTTAPDDSATIVIRKAAAKVVAQAPEPVVVPQGPGHSLPPKEMLGVVSYAYAKGVYRSEEIERKLVKDPAMRAALGDEVPDARTIRKFRRLNRGAIAATLESFFGWLRKKSPSGTSVPAAVRTPAPAQPDESTAVAVKKAAAARLDEAAVIDNMSKED